MSESFEQFMKQQISSVYDQSSCSFKTMQSILGKFIRTNLSDIETVDDFIENVDNVMKIIKSSHKSKETKRKIVYFLALACKQLKLKEAQMNYFEYYKQLKKEIIETRTENDSINKKEAECLKFSLEKLRKRELEQKTDQSSLLYNLLIFLDETPRLEFRTLVFHPIPPIKQDVNYLEKVNDGYQIVLNKYKTSRTYGQWIIPIRRSQPNSFTDDLIEYIKKYIAQNQTKRNELIFYNRNNKEYPSNKFSEFVQSTFSDKINAKLNINCIRKLKINALFHQNPKILKMSLKEQKDWVIKHFKHSLPNSMLYYKRVPEKNGDETNEEGFNHHLQSNQSNVDNMFQYYPNESMDDRINKIALNAAAKESALNSDRLYKFRSKLYHLMNQYDVKASEVQRIVGKEILI